MSQHAVLKWKASAWRFERQMLGIMSFRDSWMAVEMHSALDEAWSTAEVNGHGRDLRFSTPQAALAYAREVHKIAGDFLAEQEGLAVQEHDSAPKEESTKRAENPNADAESASQAPVSKKCKASE